MELNLCPIFAGAEQCRSRINAFSYGFVASADISQLPFVVISVDVFGYGTGTGGKCCHSSTSTECSGIFLVEEVTPWRVIQ